MVHRYSLDKIQSHKHSDCNITPLNLIISKKTQSLLLSPAPLRRKLGTEMEERTGYVREVSPEGVSVAAQQGVDETKQLHDSLVLAQIFVTLQQELVLLPITPCTAREEV